MVRELKILGGDGQVRRLRLEGETLSLGRAHGNELCYPDDASLSRRHLRFERAGGAWFVTDLGSKNGTLLNGVALSERHALQGGDRLVAGQLAIHCIDPEQDDRARVVFVPEQAQGGTLMTSLDGLLSGETTSPPRVQRATGPVLDTAEQFRLPVVQTLIRAGRELSSPMPLPELFELILTLAIEAASAERGVLMTLEAGELVARATHGEGFRISTTVRDRVLRNRESLLVRDVAREQALLQQLSLGGQAIHSLIAVPLQTREEVIGLLYLDSRGAAREFSLDDLNLLTVFANVAAIRIEHERYLVLRREEELLTRDLEQAAEIQRGILPAVPPESPGLELAGYNAPCRTVGGDYYDFIPYPDGRVALVLGDVAGKGMAAALLMSALQARVQLLTEEPASLSELFARLDRSLAARCPANRFITLFACVVDPRTGETVYCSAGHLPALLVRVAGEVESLEARGGLLGFLHEHGYEEHRARLELGDLVVLYSDGVTEACDRAGSEFGSERLARLVVERRGEPADAIVRGIVRALDDWCGAEGAGDDVTIVVARRTGSGLTFQHRNNVEM